MNAVKMSSPDSVLPFFSVSVVLCFFPALKYVRCFQMASFTPLPLFLMWDSFPRRFLLTINRRRIRLKKIMNERKSLSSVHPYADFVCRKYLQKLWRAESSNWSSLMYCTHSKRRHWWWRLRRMRERSNAKWHFCEEKRSGLSTSAALSYIPYDNEPRQHGGFYWRSVEFEPGTGFQPCPRLSSKKVLWAWNWSIFAVGPSPRKKAFSTARGNLESVVK